jgi:hypothetical protein
MAGAGLNARGSAPNIHESWRSGSSIRINLGTKLINAATPMPKIEPTIPTWLI